jgi:sporulation protein YlmC with PRC-barrel domain
MGLEAIPGSAILLTAQFRRNLHIAFVGCLSDSGMGSHRGGAAGDLACAGDGMKKFATELRGKTVMTNDGQILGTIENFIVNTKSGKVSDVLVLPAENVPTKKMKVDPEGRLVLPFQGMKAVKDVVVMNL